MENNIDIPPFYIGQEIVANTNSDTWEKGQEFTVQSIGKCKCGNWKIGIGINKQVTCFKGSCRTKSYDAWSAKCFSPKLEIKEFISMKKLAEKQLELIPVN